MRATTEGSLSEDNCHPFCCGSLMWMHNGGLGGWRHIKRRLGERLADRWYLGVVGGTDSEWAFALFLDTLERMGHDPAAQPDDGFGPTVLRQAMLRTIQSINQLIDDIPDSVLLAEHVDTRSLLNFAVSDGHSVICTRYVSSSTDEAASLYYSSGTMWGTRAQHQQVDDQNYHMERSDKGAEVVLVASEPLTFERENWANVPTNSILTIHKQTVMIHPIMDRHYSQDPHHRRSAAFVQTKGLAANNNTPFSRAATPAPSCPSPPTSVRFPASHLPQAPLSFPLGRARPAETATTLGSVLHAAPRTRTLLHHSESAAAAAARGSSESDGDGPPPPSTAVQGNIKRKRASAREGSTSRAGAGDTGSSQLDGHGGRGGRSRSLTPETSRAEFGSPHKIAQYFPELGTARLL